MGRGQQLGARLAPVSSSPPSGTAATFAAFLLLGLVPRRGRCLFLGEPLPSGLFALEFDGFLQLGGVHEILRAPGGEFCGEQMLRAFLSLIDCLFWKLASGPSSRLAHLEILEMPLTWSRQSPIVEVR